MDKEKLSEEILLSSLKTFTENENHKQKLFIQFFLGVIVVIIGYSIIYSDIEYDADIWELHRKGYFYVITSYSISSLIGAYIISQSVLILLARIIVSGGYSFRKYQMIAYRIRKECLGENFNKIYGQRKNEFSPFNKNGSFSTNSYLPEFDTIFFVCIWLLQVLLFLSFICKLATFTDNTFIKIVEPRKLIEIFNIEIKAIRFWLMPLAFIPLLLTALFQKNYYFKYLEKVCEVIPERLNNGRSNPDFNKAEHLKKYKRSISLAWGYLLFLIITQATMLLFLTINYYTDINYLSKVDLMTLMILSLFIYFVFCWNFIKSYTQFRKYASKSPSKDIISKMMAESKHFVKRSKKGKEYRTITPVILMILFLLVCGSSIFLLLNEKSFFLTMGFTLSDSIIYLLSYPTILIIVILFIAPRNFSTLLKLARQKIVAAIN